MKKLKLDLLKVEEILSRDQLKNLVGGSCTNDADCAYDQGCSDGACADYGSIDMGSGGSGSGGNCAERPYGQQCGGSHYGCCSSGSCITNGVAGYHCA